jgi:hypothetical protein
VSKCNDTYVALGGGEIADILALLLLKTESRPDADAELPTRRRKYIPIWAREIRVGPVFR